MFSVVAVAWVQGACGSETTSPDGNAGGATSTAGTTAIGGGGSGGLAADGGGGSGGIALGSSIAVEVESSRGVTVKTVFIFPSSPATRAVILLEGGDGKVNIGGTADKPVIDSQGFLARSAQALADEGLLVALLDAPSDFSSDGLTLAYRTSADQATDVEAVVDWLNAKASVPIWVLGMSIGTYSATNTAIRLGGKLSGYGVCSASTQPGGAAPYPNGILDLQMDQIAVPALVIGHQDDKCPGTPSTGVAKVVAALSNAKSVTNQIFTGGDPPKSPDCGPLAPHGYYGIEAEVIAFVAKTIETN